MKVSLKSITPNAEVNIVEIARVSSSRIDKAENPEGLINYLIKNKHWSPFEHSYMTVEIVTSKAIAIQLLRHRSFTFQEFSQRYARVTDMEDVEFRLQAATNRQSSTDVIGGLETSYFNLLDGTPDGHEISSWIKGISNDYPLETLLNQVAEVVDRSFKAYERLLEAGVAKECARMVLPMCTQTTLFMTGSVRSWIHMLDIRDDAHAQKEVQLIAKEIKALFIKELPIISKALGYV